MAVLLWLVWLAAFAGWTAALLTSYPAQVGQGLPEPVEFTAAKFLHIGSYTFFAAAGLLLPLPHRLRWLPILVLLAHVAVTEYLQTYVPLRHGCVRDVVIDYIGITLGSACAWWVRRQGWEKVLLRAVANRDTGAQTDRDTASP